MPSPIVPNKWAAKRVLALLALPVLLVAFVYFIYRGYQREPAPVTVAFCAAGVFFAMIFISASREFIARNPRAVRIAGSCLIAGGVGGLALNLFAFVMIGEAKSQPYEDISKWLFVFLLMMGLLVKQTPQTVAQIKAIRDQRMARKMGPIVGGDSS